jgi:uncharacterized protein (TIGR00369 family)
MNTQHFASLQNMYLSAPINRFFKPSIVISEGACSIQMQVREDLFHSAGAVHGSVYFKALDDSAFFAANSLCKDTFVLTSQFHIYLLAPVSAGDLLAEGRVLEARSSFWLCESTLKDSTGLILARGQGTFIKGKTELKKTKGYGTLS